MTEKDLLGLLFVAALRSRNDIASASSLVAESVLEDYRRALSKSPPQGGEG